MDKTYKVGIIAIVFCLGLYFTMNYSNKDVVEGFSSNRCPNVLIQKGSELYLYNSKQAKVPGVNPTRFSNLEDYVEFMDWLRGQGIRCPVLFLQHSYDAQGKSIYKIRPSPTDPQGGLPPTIPLGEREAPMSLLLDANRNDPPYNKNSYPGFDQFNQDIGLYTPLDQMFNEQEYGRCSDNAMDSNWCGKAYTDEQIASGKHDGNKLYRVSPDVYDQTAGGSAPGDPNAAGQYSPDTMASNWGGKVFTENLIAEGKIAH